MKILKASTIVLLLIIGQITFAQDKSYKETVIENPTADDDLKVVAAYLDALMANKMDTAASFLADTYIGGGPGYEETETKTESIESWKAAHKVRTNQKNDYVSNTVRVIDGDLKGDWVSIWGTYTFTQNSITVNMPYQYSAMIDNGKIVKSMIYYDKMAINTAMGYELIAKKQ